MNRGRSAMVGHPRVVWASPVSVTFGAMPASPPDGVEPRWIAAARRWLVIPGWCGPRPCPWRSGRCTHRRLTASSRDESRPLGDGWSSPGGAGVARVRGVRGDARIAAW